MKITGRIPYEAIALDDERRHCRAFNRAAEMGVSPQEADRALTLLGVLDGSRPAAHGVAPRTLTQRRAGHAEARLTATVALLDPYIALVEGYPMALNVLGARRSAPSYLRYVRDYAVAQGLAAFFAAL